MTVLEAVFLLVITSACGWMITKLDKLEQNLSTMQRDILILKLHAPKRKTDEQGKN